MMSIKEMVSAYDVTEASSQDFASSSAKSQCLTPVDKFNFIFESQCMEEATMNSDMI